MMVRCDPCGIVCVILIYICIGYAGYAVVVWMTIPIFGNSLWGIAHVCIFISLLLLTIASHARAMLTDPGVVPINKSSGDRKRGVYEDSEDSDCSDHWAAMLRSDRAAYDDWTFCTRCESLRPPRSHHCKICQRCIRKMDHHCPWVNNCVGEYNQKYFLQFLLYVGISCTYAIVVMSLSWVYDDEWASTGMKGPFGENAHHAKVLHSIFLAMECALFGMFVIAVACDQLNAIFTDQTAVELVQNRNRTRRFRRRSKRALMADVCGSGPMMKWFVPCSSSVTEREIVSYPKESNHFDV